MSRLLVLKDLSLVELPELEFIEEEEEVNTHNPYTSQKLFPCLKKLYLHSLPKLKGWRGKVAAEATSASSKSGCFGEAFSSLKELSILYCHSLTSLRLTPPHLLKLDISCCDELKRIELDQILLLRSLKINRCPLLKSLHIEEHLIAGLEKIDFEGCPEMRLRLLNTQDKRLAVHQGLLRTINFENLDSVLVKKSLSSWSMSSLKKISIKRCKGHISLPCAELTSLEDCEFVKTNGLQSLHTPSPHLKRVKFWDCVGLTSVEVEAPTNIVIICCSELKRFCIAHPATVQTLRITSPSSVDWCSISNLRGCIDLTGLHLSGVDAAFIKRLLSSPSIQMPVFKRIGSLTVAIKFLRKLFIKDIHGLKIMNIKSPNLTMIKIKNCIELTSVALESQLFAHSNVSISCCSELQHVRIPRPISIKMLTIADCPKLREVDWDSLPQFKILYLHPLPPPEELPQYLQKCKSLPRVIICDDEPEAESDLESESDMGF